MATQTSNGLVKSWVARAERAAAMQEREDALTAKASDSRGTIRTSTPTLLTDSYDDEDEDEDEDEEEEEEEEEEKQARIFPQPVRKGQADCAACRGKHRAHTCSLASRSAEHNLRKLGQEEGEYSDEDGLAEEQAMRVSSAFADKMQDYMREENVSQTELGQQIGLRQQQISRWIFGKGTSATRQAVERRIRAWLKKNEMNLEDIPDGPRVGPNGATVNGATAGPGAGRAKVGLSKPSLMHGSSGGGKKRKPPSISGHTVRGGRRARLADTPMEAYANNFAYALHKYIKQVGLSQEALGKSTGLRQQQISSYMFQKCSESMHQLVEQSLRNWCLRQKIEPPGFTTAQLKGKPIPWRAPQYRHRGEGKAGGKDAKRKATAHSESEDFEDDSLMSDGEDEGAEQIDLYAHAEGGAAASIKRQRAGGRSYYGVPHGTAPSRALGMARRPVSKVQAMDWAKRASELNQPLWLPAPGAFVIPRYMDQLGAVGVSGAILDARDGGIVSLEPGCSLYGAGASVRVGFGGKGGITMEVVGPPMQVSLKARAAAAAEAAEAAEAGLPVLDLGAGAVAAKPESKTMQAQGVGMPHDNGQAVSLAPAYSPESEPGDEPSEVNGGAAAAGAAAAAAGNAVVSDGQAAVVMLAAAEAPAMIMT